MIAQKTNATHTLKERMAHNTHIASAGDAPQQLRRIFVDDMVETLTGPRQPRDHFRADVKRVLQREQKKGEFQERRQGVTEATTPAKAWTTQQQLHASSTCQQRWH